MKVVMTAGALALVLGSCESTPEGDYNSTLHVWTTDHGTFGKDPISGNQVDVTKAVTRLYQSERYYFESEENARKFDADPSSFTYATNPERSANPDMPVVH